jgi:hypothetical protein
VLALTLEERRWLHDKYERLAAEEGSLSASRTSYYAAIGTVILTGLIIALDDFGGQPALLTIVVSFLAGLGLLISSVWTVLLHRTTDAQNLWREAARFLEECAPPVEGTLSAPITLRSGEKLQIDLLQPYHAHQTRFSDDKRLSWMDRVDPSALTETLPLAFLVLWATVLVGAWGWYLFVR